MNDNEFCLRYKAEQIIQRETMDDVPSNTCKQRPDGVTSNYPVNSIQIGL